MASITLAALAAALSLHQAQALAPTSQDTTTPPSAAPAPDLTRPLTWDDLPLALRTRFDEEFGKPEAQTVLMNETQVAPDADFRTIDHGATLSVQLVRPAAFATIVTPARNTRRYGHAGALLWSAIDAQGDWWCWRDGAAASVWTGQRDIYCYRDADGDGDFDAAMKNNTTALGLSHSRFQFKTLGRTERLPDTVTYAPGGTTDWVEKVVVRYDGPGAARVAADGKLVDGVVFFKLLTGPGVITPAPAGNMLVQPSQTAPVDGLDEVAPLVVHLDGEGRGRLSDPRGIVLEVDRVNLDGTARVKLVSALPVGRTLLFQPPSREEVVRMLGLILGRPAD